MASTVPVPEYDEDLTEAFSGPGYDEEEQYDDGYEDYDDELQSNELSAAQGPQVANADLASQYTHGPRTAQGPRGVSGEPLTSSQCNGG